MQETPMIEKSQNSWQDYSIKKERAVARNHVGFSSVAHVTHVRKALEILDSGSMRTQLVPDGRLNTERCLVVWLSPFQEGDTSFYGNIAFVVDWKKIIKDKRFYWVGTMPHKKPSCRIVITKALHADLVRYKPQVGDGPWWWDKTADEHYYHGTYNHQFMLEESISLHDVDRLCFVSHHKQVCAVSGRYCDDLSDYHEHAAARFLAGACSQRVLSRWPGLWVTPDGKPKESLEQAWRALRREFGHGCTFGGGPIRFTSEKASAIARAGMAAVCEKRNTDREHLLTLFRREADAIEACAGALEDDLHLDEGALPRKDKYV